jgi:hypothetical protein
LRKSGRDDRAPDTTEYCTCSNIPNLTDIRTKPIYKQYREERIPGATGQYRAKLACNSQFRALAFGFCAADAGHKMNLMCDCSPAGGTLAAFNNGPSARIAGSSLTSFILRASDGASPTFH